ncbi:acetyl-CoA carboxylase carboxyl transferase subunit alpha [Suicoccus acidiformans]|uniref:acetyl-CoA carboxytransferase n=1 Tax=Suicoccus acidiformans TaxID=2036206 RepID=A0A347WJE9_9LACT|nr:carboxyltransferase subunit alpha [Suicoccus acidiformans]AXY25206.1 acetyl-CoA carboxylase carboxyl transferase subunit alpha [Suicoccus acidiformans]
MEAYHTVQKARDVHRVSTLEIIDALTENFIEFHGDRVAGDDKAIIGGIGMMGQQALTIIGVQKGLTTHENIKRNFGSSGPSGYRKAQRLMKQAEKFNRPVLTLINTSGAYAAPESEEGGIGEAIASSLMTMAELTVPTLAIILGEGGSGGAIALALADEVWMLEHAVYSILSPEGFASILWKDSKLAPQAADLMRLTAPELKELGIIERIITETNPNGEPIERSKLLEQLCQAIETKFNELVQEDVATRVQAKQARFRKF